MFESPKGHRTHPMSEKARGAIFNALGDITGLTILDAYAGSGAIAFEALSRGARHAVAIDNDKYAHQAIKQNAESLGLEDQMTIKRRNVSGWSAGNQDVKFDIIVCDPPYDNIQRTALHRLAGHLRPGGVFIVSWPGGEEIPAIPGLLEVSRKSYGDAQLVFYKSASEQ